MSFKIGGFNNSLGGDNQIGKTPIFASKQTLGRYEGGSLPVAINRSDTQQTFARRGLHDHAVAAGLSEAEADKFADQWTNQKTTFKHYDNGNARPYTPTEFANLKTKGKTNFDLNKDYDASILADLNVRVEENRPIVAEEAFAYTPDERAAIMQQYKGASASRSAITGKPDMMLTNGLTKGGKVLDADTALGRYVEKNYNQNGRVWGDKINEMVSLAKTEGVAVELKFNDDGTALVGVNAADKQKLDNLFNQALGETIKGEQASLKGQREGTRMAADIPITLVNAVTKAVEGLGNIPATIEDLNHAARTPEGVRTIATVAGVPPLIGNAASELMPESAPLTPENRITSQVDLSSLLIPNKSDLFNKDATGKINPNGQTLGKTAATVTSLVIPIPVGKTAEVVVDTAVKLGTKVARQVGKFGEETAAGMRVFGEVELATANGASVGKSGTSIDQIAGQTAEDLNSKIVTVDSNGNPSGTRFRSDYEDHISQREFSKASQKSGVNGAHEMTELEQYAIKPGVVQTKESIKILSKTVHPTVKGVYKIEYQMPKLDMKGQPTGLWRSKSGTDPFVKTVYDSSIIPNEEMARWGREAFADAVQHGGIDMIKRTWSGNASNGLRIGGYVDDKTNAVRTFYPEF